MTETTNINVLNGRQCDIPIAEVPITERKKQEREDSMYAVALLFLVVLVFL